MEIKGIYLLHPSLVRRRRVAVDGEEVREALAEFLVFDRLWRDVHKDEALQHLLYDMSNQQVEEKSITCPVVCNHTREHQLCKPDAHQRLDLLRFFLVQDQEQELYYALALR